MPAHFNRVEAVASLCMKCQADQNTEPCFLEEKVFIVSADTRKLYQEFRVFSPWLLSAGLESCKSYA